METASDCSCFRSSTVHVSHTDGNYTWKCVLNIYAVFSKSVMNHLCCCFPGPNHMPMQGPGPGPNQPPNMPSGSMNMPPSSHGSMGGYNHTVPSSQGMPAQSQMNMTQGQPMGNYGPRPNMNMQPNQGKTHLLVSTWSCWFPLPYYLSYVCLLHIIYPHLINHILHGWIFCLVQIQI